MKEFFKRPMVFHGIMAGLLLIAIKMFLYFSHNWMIRLGQMYNLIAFLAIVAAMIMGSLGERKIRNSFNYGQAWVSCIVVISFAVFISLIGDQVVYRVLDPTLPEQAKAFQLKTAYEGFQKTNFFSEEWKEKMLDKIEKTPASTYYSIPNFFISWITFIFANGLWALIIAIFTRKKKVDFPELDRMIDN